MTLDYEFGREEGRRDTERKVQQAIGGGGDGGWVLLIILLPFLFELYIVGLFAYKFVGPTDPQLRAIHGLDLHPIFGWSAAIFAALFYYIAYSSRIFSIVLGVVMTICWCLGVFIAQNMSFPIDAFASDLMQFGTWHRIPLHFAHTKWGWTFFATVGSALDRVLLYRSVKDLRNDQTTTTLLEYVKGNLSLPPLSLSSSR